MRRRPDLLTPATQRARILGQGSHFSLRGCDQIGVVHAAMRGSMAHQRAPGRQHVLEIGQAHVSAVLGNQLILAVLAATLAAVAGERARAVGQSAMVK